jgi:signal transduction histidine kinase
MRLVNRFWILLTVPVVVCLAVYGVVSSRFRRAELLREAEHEVRDTATLLGTAITALPPDIEATELHLLAERLTRDSRVLGVGIYDRNGQWLGGSRVAVQAHEDLSPAVSDALRTRLDHREVRVIAGHECLARVEVLASHQDSPAGAVLVLRDLDYIDEALRSQGFQLAIVACVLAAAMALVAARIARSLTDPVERFLSGVARVAEGDLDASVPEEGPAELERLGRGFNELTRSLRQARARLADEEAARSALEAELNRAQMLAVAGQVAATLGHEIGSPLNVILGKARMTSEREDLAPEIRATLDSIAAQCERITRVVSQFLSLTRPTAPTREAFTEVPHVAREVVAFLGHEARRRKIKTEVEVKGDGPWTVACSHDRLFQVLFNLCMNAFQAQPEGGRVAVSVTRESERREGFEDRSVIVAEVADDGPGVPEAIRGKVFDPFFSTRLGQGGTGLGLAVVAGVVRELGGKVSVDNVRDRSLKGAVFRVSLPVAR